MSRNTVDRLLTLAEAPRFKGRVKPTAYEEEALRAFARVLLELAFEVLGSKK